MIDPTRPLDPIPFASDAWWSLRDRVAGSREQHPDRPCIRCAARFTPKVGNQVYCSRECAYQATLARAREGRRLVAALRARRRQEGETT